MSENPCEPGKLFAPIHSIRMRTEIPGPKSREILARSAAASGNPKINGLSMPIIVAKAHGALVTDVDSNTFIDFASGANGLIVGHTPETIVTTLQTQADTVTHVYERIGITQDYVDLCELLNEITPEMGGPKKTSLFAASTNVWGIVGGLSTRITGREVAHIVRSSADDLPDVLISHLHEYAAIILNWDFPQFSADVIQEIADHCKMTGTLLISDERQSGFGRTGKLFAIENFNVQPDMVISYGMGIGAPLTTITARAALLEPIMTDHWQYSPADAFAYSASIRSIHLIREQNFANRALQIGEIIRERAAEWNMNVLGLGAMLAIEVLNADAAREVIRNAIQSGLLLANQREVNFIPLAFPLMIPEEQLNEGLDVLESALKSTLP